MVHERADSKVSGLELFSADTAAVDVWYVLPELAFILVVAGMTCTAAGLAGHAVAWSLPAGVALLAGAGVLLAQVGASSPSMGLIAVAAICVGLELLTGFGLHAAGAATSLLLAGLALSGSPDVHPVLAVPASLALGVGVFAAAFTSWRRRRERPFDTTPRMIGRGAIVLTDARSAPRAVVAGELWPLDSWHDDLKDGQFVRVVQVRNGRLVVRAARPPTPR
jgi:membrane-bound ClpP family serine protease